MLVRETPLGIFRQSKTMFRTICQGNKLKQQVGIKKIHILKNDYAYLWSISWISYYNLSVGLVKVCRINFGKEMISHVRKS